MNALEKMDLIQKAHEFNEHERVIFRKIKNVLNELEAEFTTGTEFVLENAQRTQQYKITVQRLK
jgi:hypothetical protein